jgi:hypothetical protein
MHGLRRFDYPSRRPWVSGAIIITALAINAAAFAGFPLELSDASVATVG